MGSNNRKKFRKQQQQNKRKGIVEDSSFNAIKETQTKRTFEERKFESLNIIYQLKQNGLSSSYPAITELLRKLNDFVVSGIECELNIPFPEKNKIIKGKLTNRKAEDVVVLLREKVFENEKVDEKEVSETIQEISQEIQK